MRTQAILLPGGVMPAELAYGALLAALGDDVQAVAKELEIYADATPPAGTRSSTRPTASCGPRTRPASTASTSSATRPAAPRAWRSPPASRAAASLALIEPAWMGNDELSRGTRDLARFDRIAALPPEQMLPAFVANQLAAGVEPPPPPPGPRHRGWRAARPGARLVETFAPPASISTGCARSTSPSSSRSAARATPTTTAGWPSARHDLPRLDARGLRGAPPLRSSAPDRARAHGDRAASALGARERLSGAVTMGSWPRRRARTRMPRRSTRAGPTSRAAAGRRRAHASNAPRARRRPPRRTKG